MPGFLPDTSCMVAAMCTWHEHRDRAAEEIERRLSRDETMIVAAPGLVEAYAVLTRLPPPHRLSPADALALLEVNFMSVARIVALDGKSYLTLLRRARDDGVAGGLTYDAVIAVCAFKARAGEILTFNESHFLSFAARGMEVVVPGRG